MIAGLAGVGVVTLLERLRARMRWHEAADQAADQMLQLHLDNLEMRFKTLQQAQGTPGSFELAAEIHDTFARRRKPPPVEPAVGSQQTRPLTWDDAYRLDSQIACLLEGPRLRQDIRARLRYAVSDKVPEAVQLQAGYTDLLKEIESASAIPADEALRDFLLEILEAIHWHSKRKHLTRKLRAQATRRTLSIGLAALMLTLLPYIITVLAVTSQGKAATLASLQVWPVAEDGEFAKANSWIHFALYTSVAFGFLGALFSRLITLQTQWSVIALDELYNARSYHYIILRASIGVLGALVVYFFLQSGLVEGSVFPKFTDLSLHMQTADVKGGVKWPGQLLLPSSALALLIMWSFIAGFSESLVPTVLANTERQFAGATSGRSG
jgi:hypothetical protein